MSLYIHSFNGKVIYPFVLSELKKLFPTVGFPEVVSDEMLGAYAVYPVRQVFPERKLFFKYREDLPVLTSTGYEQRWIEQPMTEEEILVEKANKWSQIRTQRNQMIQHCDWTILPDTPFTAEKRQEWITYRQALRDITQQPDPFNINWPTKPQ